MIESLVQVGGKVVLRRVTGYFPRKSVMIESLVQVGGKVVLRRVTGYFPHKSVMIESLSRMQVGCRMVSSLLFSERSMVLHTQRNEEQ
jgi:acetolactate synthase small subunit